MDNCSSLTCCEQCKKSLCVWGQTWNEPGKCVRRAADLGSFIIHEVHPGQSCYFPGSEPGKCESSIATESHDGTGWTKFVIWTLLGLGVILFGVVLWWWIRGKRKSGVYKLPSRFVYTPDGRLERRSHSVCRTPDFHEQLGDPWDLPLRRTVTAPRAPPRLVPRPSIRTISGRAGPAVPPRLVPSPAIRTGSFSSQDQFSTADDDSLL